MGEQKPDQEAPTFACEMTLEEHVASLRQCHPAAIKQIEQKAREEVYDSVVGSDSLRLSERIADAFGADEIGDVAVVAFWLDSYRQQIEQRARDSVAELERECEEVIRERDEIKEQRDRASAAFDAVTEALREAYREILARETVAHDRSLEKGLDPKTQNYFAGCMNEAAKCALVVSDSAAEAGVELGVSDE